VKLKRTKQEHYGFAPLIKLFARFARSRSKFWHVIYAFLCYTALKSGFSESLVATFSCGARRHSLKTLFWSKLDSLLNPFLINKV